MFNQPRHGTLPWHQQLQWRNWIQSLFNMAARTREYRLDIQEGGVVAGISTQNKTLILHPELREILDTKRGTHRFDPGHDHDRLSLLLRATVTHEAGHVQFSDARPTEPLLGDIWNILEDERMERCMVRRFPELYSDFTFLGDVMLSLHQTEGLDLPTACLVWRWAHDRPDVPFTTANNDLWENEIRPRVEAAWESDRAGTLQLAKEIIDLLPEEERTAPPETSADGGGSNASQPEERPPRSPQAQHGSKASGSSDADSDEQEAGETGRAGSEDGQGPGEKAGEETGEETGEDFSSGSETESSENSPAEHDRRSTANGPDAGKRNSLQHPLSEQAGEEAGEEQATGSAGHGEALPEPPLAPETSDDPLREIEGLARSLATALAPPTRPAGTRTHRTKGRFSYGHYEQGRERYFRHRVKPGKPDRYVLKVAIDISSSMQGPRLKAARQAALMVIRAAELSQGRTDLMAFNDQVYSIGDYGTSTKEQYRAVARLRAEGGTNLAQAMDMLLLNTAQPGEEEVIVVISDGAIDRYDQAHCAALMQNETRMVLPVLIGDAAFNSVQWSAAFGYTMPVMDLQDIARTIKTHIQRKRMQALA
ncbi:von Willebrand factor type A (plasmid) [Deinococcus proteolyticus MRP]|uniref:von Willebrand factor type A n=1 Tax=Deinococcus proteolyticus (strain ATCC 35074 / DSM 20540 / JCM 6276 / NBRC 101906 / NCIMB 13154 / VKM Ac-1939 / CCM 2703 / MRP) TaxID=693977 RepID=F0RQB2_DEIPM|nr:VWA domain-containing protein [Deinococcus proteolyticus]ADY27471.1 von Willebrand factor type A [Deinococcus proteolyticus MRP]